MKFRATLPPGERHLVSRLESFGDIVVGFSMSQLALQLDIPKTPQEVFAHALRYGVFFGAFGIVSVFWYRFHRIMSTGFAPRRLDMILLFAFLAFVALTPYALLTYTRLRGPDGYSPEGLGLYLGVFLGVILFSWVLTFRGMRRAWGYFTEPERREVWQAIIAGGVAVPVFAIALAAVALYGTRGVAGVVSVSLLIPILTRLLRTPWPAVVGPQAGIPAGTLGAVEVS